MPEPKDNRGFLRVLAIVGEWISVVYIFQALGSYCSEGDTNLKPFLAAILIILSVISLRVEVIMKQGDKS